ncbi:MAG: glycoside hydrolase family 3 N-terminal domain-containing protein, partial [Bacteroidota bacterium]
LAPVVDINNNPLNPVINYRSFGENKKRVAEKGLMYMKGMQDHGILASAKHFPGHGDTDADSHLTLPVISKTRESIDSLELFPFRELIRQELGGVMVGHLYLPAYDSGVNTPTTLSKNIITHLLRENLHFNGFIITDALDMQGVTKFFKPGEIEEKAFMAGNDILLLSKNVEAAVKRIALAADSGIISKEEIEIRCRKILHLKFKEGLANRALISTKNLYNDLNPISSELLLNKLYKEAITLIKNDNNLVPLKFLDRKNIAILSVGSESGTSFEKAAGWYAPVTAFHLPSSFTKHTKDSLLTILQKYDQVIITLHPTWTLPGKNFGLCRECIDLVDSCARVNQVILVLFGSPYSLKLFSRTNEMGAILVAYEDHPVTAKISAEILFGGVKAKGHLPVTASSSFPYNSGIITEKTRLEKIAPEVLGISSSSLVRIDSIALNGIDKNAFPGCEILMAKDGKVFYEKSFGKPTYTDSVTVMEDDLYDLASVTKVAATTLSMMKLYDEGRFRLDDAIGIYLPELKGSNKEKLAIRDIMTHQAGLQSWIRFYQQTIKNGNPDPACFQSVASEEYPVRVADHMYLKNNWHDTIMKALIESPVSGVKEYKYSDLGFYLLRMMVEKITGVAFESYLDKNFYRPMGLTTLTFKPLEKFPVSRIMPTENDTLFRKHLIRGDVHDPGAAMLGGVSGHAGLFAD